MMHRLRAVALVATVVATTLVGVGAGAFADPGNASHVDELTAAVVDPEGITVTGRATFVDVPVVVDEDEAEDAVGSTAPLGHELTTATISRPDPFADTLRFAIGVANQPPAINGVPEFVSYTWRFIVTAGGEERAVVLSAYRSSQWINVASGSLDEPLDPVFVVRVCDADARCVADVGASGSMGDDIVAWNVPLGPDQALGQIGLAGAVVTAEVKDNIRASSTVSGLTSGGVGDLSQDFDVATTDIAYTVPGPGVRVGIAPAGTAPEDVPLTAAGTVNSQGAFSGSLPTPATPGEYTVVVQACHGADSCGIAATSVTV